MKGTTKAKRKNRVQKHSLPNSVTVALGRNLKKRREAKKMSQEDLAFDAEVERSRIGKLENGHLNPSLMTLSRICHSLDITLPQLFAGITVTNAPDTELGEHSLSRVAHVDASRPKSARTKITGTG